MKKILSLILVLTMICSALVLTSCGAKEAKLGLGVVTSVEATAATEEKNGDVTADITAAAVLLSADGKILDCDIDALQAQLPFTADGKIVAVNSFSTKRDLKESYGMSTYAKTTEWYLQADKFEALVIGKTVTEVKALVLSDGFGNDDVVNAGCTIGISDFVSAIAKACESAKNVGSVEGDALAVAITAEYDADSSKDATEEADGVVQAEVSFAAVSVKDGKVTGAVTDAMNANFKFGTNGEATETSVPKTKGELKEGYGMAAYAQTTEYYLQAEIFDKECVGKDATGIRGLSDNNDLITAGCTIDVLPLVEAVTAAIKEAK